MKKIILKFLDKHKSLKKYIYTIYKYYKYNGLLKAIIFTFKGIFLYYNPSYKLCRGQQIKRIFKKIKLKKVYYDKFLLFIDEYKILYSNKNSLENTTVDYSIILEKSLNDLYNENNKLKECDYKQSQKYTLEGIEILLDKTIKYIETLENNDRLKEYFYNIKNNETKHFEEALQRILFYNQILWQTGHTLNGLGRLDKILYKYYKNDIDNNVLSYEEAQMLISKFLNALHSYYWIKSSALLGDTGQIIILGGLEENGKYLCNELSYMFIDELKKLQLPDPKILLRVCDKTPKELLEKSIECISTGIGCPLFANDDVIIPNLIKFGYEKIDSYNYVTSACWEPLIPNKSVEQNNIKSLVFMKPFLQLFEECNLDEINSFSSLVERYEEYLEKYIINFFDDLDNVIYEEDPIFSIFVPSCNDRLLDVTKGGAVYNNFGATTVSLANVVNSLINIDYFVFKNKKYTLKEFNQIRKCNYSGYEGLNNELKNILPRFGNDEEYVINLFNDITSYTSKILEKMTNKLGGKLKIGFSAPTYIIESKNQNASFDGRKSSDPFIVHISSDIQSLSYSELVSFASRLDYTGNRFNGNVVDFMVTPNFIKNNKDKFLDFIIISIKIGFFEMQMNVVSSEILIKARKNPEKFPNLIVRVWGFSAYFKDLPDEYKDYLIERALKNEGKSN